MDADDEAVQAAGSPLAVELAQIKESLDTAEASIRADAEQRRIENKTRDRRIRWSQRAVVGALVAGLLGVIVGIVGIVVGRGAQATADDILAARSQGRASVCTAVQSLTNGLISASPPSVDDTAREKQQAAIDAFEAQLESDLKAIECDLHLLPARGVPEGQP